MSNKDITEALRKIIMQQIAERKFTKQKTYSHTLTENLFQDLTQLKLQISCQSATG